MIAVLYFGLRLKQFWRILRRLGVAVSLLFAAFMFLALYVLIKTSYSWIMPAAVILCLLCYHNERKDKDFLSQQVKCPALLLMAEYILIGLPFVVIECIRSHYVAAAVVMATAVLLPKLKTIKMKSAPVPLPFLYKGGLEYIRMFRMYGWLYFLLLIVTVIGALHANIRIGKVALIVWGIVQTMSFASVPQRQELTFYLNYSAFQRHLVLSSVWNAVITAVPFVGIILSFSFSGDNLLFAVSVISGSILYLCNMGMVRHMSFSSASLAVYQLIVLIPLFFFTCFIPLLLVPFVLINVLCCIFLKDNLKNIWN